jgi:thiosulfate/3-mercaptopyruvate sulfurtransferase
VTRDSNLISVEELSSRVGAADLRVIDCRFDLADTSAGRRSYLDAHIPGAVYADLDKDLAAPVAHDTGRHPLPAPETFAATCQRFGVSNTTEVVVYDRDSGAVAARAWWMLRWLGHPRARVLDGGFERWVKLSNPTVGGTEMPEPREFVACPRPDWLLTTDELASRTTRIATLNLFDARDAARFRGEHEPIDPVAGHIPGSHNLPYSVSLAADGRWKSTAELEALWGLVLGDDKSKSWAVMCGSGVTACHLALSAAEAGYSAPRLYAGSWSEWIRDPTRPIGRDER